MGFAILLINRMHAEAKGKRTVASSQNGSIERVYSLFMH